MSPTIECETKVFLNSSLDYLSHIRKIAACIAECAGMDRHEVDEAELALTEACLSAILQGSMQDSKDKVLITFRSSKSAIVVDVTKPTVTC